MSVNPRVVHKRRATITALPLYYSGHLLKKHTEDKDFKSYYGELRGATLFLYTDDTQDTYTEKLDLEQLKSMELNSPYQRKTPTIFTLTLLSEEVQLKMDNPDTGEEWRGYILTVVKVSKHAHIHRERERDATNSTEYCWVLVKKNPK
ncbi:signal-transducing adaptor protein 1-like [Seriola lalandi dorsalis]|uniref:signal-transducing adaptor protein 1-like n=1 Tax=Seriola lalandi dorsalis TaxID=1841481 RepID=UPI000C6F75DE|nr:signal-transducing adaptor protein 1-like [Seriola lalandi dorsalis]